MHEVLSHLPRMVHTASLTCVLILVDCLLQDVHISGRGIFLNAFSKLQCPVNLLLRIVLVLGIQRSQQTPMWVPARCPTRHRPSGVMQLPDDKIAGQEIATENTVSGRDSWR